MVHLKFIKLGEYLLPSFCKMSCPSIGLFFGPLMDAAERRLGMILFAGLLALTLPWKLEGKN